MNPVSPVIEGQESRETVYAKNQSEYLPLPAIVMQGSEREVLTRWELTNEEKIALLSGGQIFLSLWTFGHPLQPIRLRVARPEEIAEEYKDHMGQEYAVDSADETRRDVETVDKLLIN